MRHEAPDWGGAGRRLGGGPGLGRLGQRNRLRRSVRTGTRNTSSKETQVHSQKGFTLIELLIVLVIIGILTAIAVPQFTETREKAFFAAMKADARNLANQQELHYADNYSYSSDVAALNFVASEGVTVTPAGTTSGWSATVTHTALGDDEGCAIYYGTVADKPTIGGKTPEAEGQIACTG